jgi:hypothetical protein
MRAKGIKKSTKAASTPKRISTAAGMQTKAVANKPRAIPIPT